MKNITCILLLTSFLALQYARQVSYLECRISNYFKKEEKCDCEKLVKEFAGKSEPSSVPISHNHFHLDESFYPPRITTGGTIFNTETFAWCIAWRIFIKKMVPGRLDRPPQN